MSWIDDENEADAERDARLTRERDERIRQIEADEEAARQAKIEMERPWNANETYLYAIRHAKYIYPGFQLDEYSKDFFEKASLYFSNDLRFEERGYGSLNKGLFVTGSTGTGKTLAMKAFSKQKRNCYEMKSVMSIVDEFQLTGMEAITKYFTKNCNRINDWQTFLNTNYYNQKHLGVCFDDLGVEDIPAVHFGQKVIVFEKIISYRYEMDGAFDLTHFTSNLSGDEVEERYGTRVKSRLREMCNFIVMKGPDRRK